MAALALGGACLLVDTDESPVLVDTGLGLHDYSHPPQLAPFYNVDTGIHVDPKIRAGCQITRLGYQPEDVHHIILTHLHFDHADGLPDFPHAWVHVYQSEYNAFYKIYGLEERLAYNRQGFSHGPRWVFHVGPAFEVVRF